MAVRRITRKEMKRDEFVSAVGRLSLWMEEHVREALVYAGVTLALIVGTLLMFGFLARREDRASALLARGIEMVDAPVRGMDPSGQTQGFLSFATEDEKYRAVLDQMDSILQTYPRSEAGKVALYYEGLCFSSLRRPQEAVRTLESFLSSNPGSFLAPMARAALAGALESSGDSQKALRIYQELSQGKTGSYPPQAALMEMGRCFEKLGKKEEARKVYRQVTTDYPDSDYSREADQRLKDLS